MEFAELIGDPLQMAMNGMQGKQEFTLETSARAIWIGMKAGGADKSFEEVGELCHKHGSIAYIEIATKYLIDMVTQGESDEDSKKKKKKA